MTAKPRKPAASPWHISQLTAWMLLLISLSLALIGIATHKRANAVVNHLRQEVESLRLQKRHVRAKWLIAEKAGRTAVAKPAIPVLYAVAGLRDGERERIDTDLVQPLLSFYAAEPESMSPQAVMIERRMPASKDVNVRLFLPGGTETSYLWPRTHALNGVWIPPCTHDVASASKDLPLCTADAARMMP